MVFIIIIICVFLGVSNLYLILSNFTFMFIYVNYIKCSYECVQLSYLGYFHVKDWLVEKKMDKFIERHNYVNIVSWFIHIACTYFLDCVLLIFLFQCFFRADCLERWVELNTFREVPFRVEYFRVLFCYLIFHWCYYILDMFPLSHHWFTVFSLIVVAKLYWG